MEARALWHESAHSSSLWEEQLPEKKGRLLLRSICSLVSLGTERLVATGHVPPPLFDIMKVPYQGGSFSFPLKYGYSLVGRVQEGPPEWEGKLVHVLHPHQDYCLADPGDCYPLPSEVSPARAALASNMETAVTAIWDSGMSAGDRVLIVGFGLIGALCARVSASFPAAEVWVSETDAYRRQLAQNFGFPLWSKAPGAPAFDLAIHCSGRAGGLQTAIEGVGEEGKVIELSWYGDRPVEAWLGGSFHRQRKQLISSQVSTIPAARHARWDFRRRRELVWRLLRDSRWEDLIDQRILLADAPAFFGQLRRGAVQRLSCLITY